MVTYLVMASVVAVLGGAAWSWALHVRQQRRIDALEGRLASLLAGMSLLTDTTESGMRDLAAELGRLAATTPAPKPRARAATQRRVVGAARRGQSVQDIAALEQMSEGEVNLRLSLNGQRVDEVLHAAVR